VSWCVDVLSYLMIRDEYYFSMLDHLLHSMHIHDLSNDRLERCLLYIGIHEEQMGKIPSL
jgi:hypothetical protein